MFSIKIEKNVPFSISATVRMAACIWEKLEIGDSILFPPNVKRFPTEAFKIKFPKRRFISRKVENGIRVWRIDDIS